MEMPRFLVASLYPQSIPPTALPNLAIDAAKPARKAIKPADGARPLPGVRPSGSRFWRPRSFLLGKARIPALADLRQKRDQAKRLIIAGADPSVRKKLERITAEVAARTAFGLIAKE